MTADGIDREELARLTERLRGLKDRIEELGAIARAGITEVDKHAIAEHPDLDTLGHEMRNLYGGTFDFGA